MPHWQPKRTLLVSPQNTIHMFCETHKYCLPQEEQRKTDFHLGMGGRTDVNQVITMSVHQAKNEPTIWECIGDRESRLPQCGAERGMPSEESLGAELWWNVGIVYCQKHDENSPAWRSSTGNQSCHPNTKDDRSSKNKILYIPQCISLLYTSRIILINKQ